jgi:hypothetical protein
MKPRDIRIIPNRKSSRKREKENRAWEEEARREAKYLVEAAT